MRYKKGDRVRIKSLEWYNANKDEDGKVYVYCDSYAIFIQVMSKFCGQTVTISEVVGDLYGILEDDGDYSWADYMIECLIESAIENKPQDRMVSLDAVCNYLYNNWKGEDYYMSDIIEGLRKAMKEC